MSASNEMIDYNKLNKWIVQRAFNAKRYSNHLTFMELDKETIICDGTMAFRMPDAALMINKSQMDEASYRTKGVLLDAFKDNGSGLLLSETRFAYLEGYKTVQQFWKSQDDSFVVLLNKSMTNMANNKDRLYAYGSATKPIVRFCDFLQVKTYSIVLTCRLDEQYAKDVLQLVTRR